MTKNSFACFSRCMKIVCVGLVFLINRSNAQTSLQLSNLSFFKSPSANWRIAGDVNADLNTKGLLTVKDGTGVLVNTPVNGGASADLFSNQEFGDIDLELDYMMSKGSTFVVKKFLWWPGIIKACCFIKTRLRARDCFN